MEQRLIQTRQKLLDALGSDASWEPVTPLDFFYTDGSAVGSCGKLILSKRENINYVCIVYFFPSEDYWVTGSLTPEETKIIKEWLESARSAETSSGENP